jgi:hypothetical protein
MILLINFELEVKVLNHLLKITVITYILWQNDKMDIQDELLFSILYLKYLSLGWALLAIRLLKCKILEKFLRKGIIKN